MRHTTPIIFLAIIVFAATLTAGGCGMSRRSSSGIGRVDAEFMFRNVRATHRGDEWDQISEAMLRGVTSRDRGAVIAATATATPEAVSDGPSGLDVANYEVTISLTDTRSLTGIRDELAALAERRSRATGEVLGFELVDTRMLARMDYATSYSSATLDRVARGATLPGSRVTLFLGGEPQTFEVKDGTWSREVRLASGDRWLYGRSEPPYGRTRWFRINLSDGSEQPISSERDFRRLRREEP